MLSDYQTLVDDLVRDQDAKVATAQRDRAINAAVLEYSKRKPDVKVQDVAGDGTRLLALPAAWELDFSAPRSIEYPIGDLPPTLLESIDFYESPAALKFLLENAIANGQNARVNYTIRHKVDGANDTIPIDDREAVSNYAAAICFDELAAAASGDTDSTLNADAVDHQGRGARYAAASRNLRQRFYDQIGVDPKKNIAAGAIVDLNLKDSLGGPRLTHA